jgi:hypothetical protein
MSAFPSILDGNAGFACVSASVTIASVNQLVPAEQSPTSNGKKGPMGATLFLP